MQAHKLHSPPKGDNMHEVSLKIKIVVDTLLP